MERPEKPSLPHLEQAEIDAGNIFPNLLKLQQDHDRWQLITQQVASSQGCIYLIVHPYYYAALNKTYPTLPSLYRGYQQLVNPSSKNTYPLVIMAEGGKSYTRVQREFWKHTTKDNDGDEALGKVSPHFNRIYFVPTWGDDARPFWEYAGDSSQGNALHNETGDWQKFGRLLTDLGVKQVYVGGEGLRESRVRINGMPNQDKLREILGNVPYLDGCVAEAASHLANMGFFNGFLELVFQLK